MRAGALFREQRLGQTSYRPPAKKTPNSPRVAPEPTNLLARFVFVFTFAAFLAASAAGCLTVECAATDASCSTGAQLSLLSGIVVGPGPSSAELRSLYPDSGDWNDYVKNDGPSPATASGTPCDGSESGGYAPCLHGGERLRIAGLSLESCENVSAEDSLGALRWRCDESSGTPIVYSYRLADGKRLSDLIDFDGLAWKSLSAEVAQNGAVIATTTEATAWTNPIQAVSGASLAGEGVVYVLKSNPSLELSLDADRTALVTQPGVTASAPGGTNLVSSATRKFVWLELQLDATAYEIGLRLDNSAFSVVRGAQIADINGTNGKGIRMAGASYNRIEDVSIQNPLQMGITVSGGATGNRLENIRIANSGTWALYLSNNSTRNRVYRLRAYGNGGKSVELGGNALDNSMVDAIAASGDDHGTFLFPNGNDTDGNAMQFLTNMNLQGKAVNLVGFAVQLEHNSVVGVATGNSIRGLALDDAQRGVVSDAAAAHASQDGFQIINTSFGNYFTGLLKAGNNTTNCLVAAGAGDLQDVTCAATGASDHTPTVGAGVDFTNSFVGKVTTDDANNPDDASGSALHASITDWLSFENSYRLWGLDGGAFPAADHQGACAGGDVCRIWDFSLRSADTILRNIVTAPDGNATLAHRWTAADQASCETDHRATWTSICTEPPYDDVSAACAGRGGAVQNGCITIHLRNAFERPADDIGNENLLCESGEICIFAPNIGAYQGHGEPGAPVTTSGAIEATVLRYPENGY